MKLIDYHGIIPIYVVERGANILGMHEVLILQIEINGATLRCFTTTYMATELPPDLAVDFRHLFEGTLGLARGFVHNVKVRRGVQPVSPKLRRLSWLYVKR